MSLALYRKYRPATFAEVIGQEHVTGPLQQALRGGRVHHAYLFSGPRGCGKTSSARILARSLNCETGPTPDPCGSCVSCVALAPNGPGSLDVVEIDAASHGLVDDARDLRERAFYAPVSSRYKVYIVDEAHMVSTAGFNALLKLVEEPPPHLKFVFATTEPDKVISTIRSRTFHYPFRLVPPGVLTEFLAGICQREGVVVDPLVLPLVARAGAGSVRDCLSILDQLLAGVGSDGLTYPAALALLGYTDAALLDEVVDAIAAGDGATVFEAVDRTVEAGHDPRRFAADLLERFRDLILLTATAAADPLITLPPDQVERMRAQAARFDSAALSRAADQLAAGLTEMRGATSPRLMLELVCARILLPETGGDLASLLTRLARLERRLSITESAQPPVEPTPAKSEPRPQPDVSPVESPVESPAAAPEVIDLGESSPARGVDAATVRRVWPELLDVVKTRGRVARALLNDATVTSADEQEIVLAFPTSSLARQFSDPAKSDVLRAALREILGIDRRVRAVASGGAPAAEPDPVVDSVDSGPEPADAAVALLTDELGAKVISED